MDRTGRSRVCKRAKGVHESFAEGRQLGVELLVGDAIRTYWTNFAKTGNPNGEGLPLWPAFDADNARVIELGDSVEARDMPDKFEHELMDAYMATMRPERLGPLDQSRQR